MSTQESGTAVLDSTTFRNACGQFLTGVTIVTTSGVHGGPVGMTANAFTSVSLDPPLVLVCVDRSAASLTAMERAGRYVVHVLSQEQEELSNLFAKSSGDGHDKFDGIPWSASRDGIPLLDEYLARFECRIVDRHEAGDHVVYFGLVEAIGERNESVAPLGFYRGQYARIV